MLKVIPFAHNLIKEIAEPKDILIDATCGNGNDTLFLSRLINSDGHVYAFDIQEEAINSSRKRLAEEEIKNVTLILDSHTNINTYLNEKLSGKVGGAIFNLGYLPRSDKKVITQPETTIEAINNIFPYLKTGGRIVLVVYYGHDGGVYEKNELLKFVQELDRHHYSAIQYQFINQHNTPPFVIAIEKQ